MNRFRFLTAVAFAAVFSLAGLIALGPSPSGTVAQDDSTEGHLLVGTWVVDNDLESDSDVPETMIFSSDGTLVDYSGGTDLTLGVWEPTGPTTATVTFTQYWSDENGDYAGGFTVRASLELSEDGSSFIADYTLEAFSPDGTMSGQAGPGQVAGTRMVAETPGTPVMTQDELFSSFGGGGTPEATPAS